MKYWLQFIEKSRSGGTWGGLRCLSETILNKVVLKVGLSWLMLELCCDICGDKMAAKMAILAIKSAKMSQDGAQEAAKWSQDGILGSRFEALTLILVSFLMPFS